MPFSLGSPFGARCPFQGLGAVFDSSRRLEAGAIFATRTPKAGRLWQRSRIDELGLQFSRFSLDFLISLTANKPADWPNVEQLPIEQLTIADYLFLSIAYESLRREPELAASLRDLRCFQTNALCRLLYPEDFDGVFATELFGIWFTPVGTFVLEAMQPLFESRWLEMEREKGQISDWQRMGTQGEAQHQLLNLFMDAADRAGRVDLARFLLAVLSKLLAAPETTIAFWTAGLQGSGPSRLAERLEIQRAAVALLRGAMRLRQWEQRARASGFMDDDYPASQFWLNEWERLNGSQSLARAEQIVQSLEPL